MSDYTQVSITSLNSVISQVNHISSLVENAVECVLAVNERVSYVDQKVQSLQASFLKMMIDQRNAAALQRAITEIIRVRQELERRFGVHKEVREHILGILQATDLALVKQNTVSRVSEELMLKAPQYWLAPCLVALSAWICNDEALANRAIKEAVRRDKEKTCMLFALICQRAGRTNTCFEWLREYFGMQNPEKMRSSVIAFIDCYENDIFGDDKDNVCVDNISHWVKTLKERHPDFDKEQKDFWKKYYESFGSRVKNGANYLDSYKELKAFCPEFNLIEGFVSRIEGTELAKGDLKEKAHAVIDPNFEKQRIDAELRCLITGFEDVATEKGQQTEEDLRYEEMFFQKVKEAKGDEETADRYVRLVKQKQFDAPVDFVERLRTAVLDQNAPVSAKKTAVKLLKSYIIDAYKEYITENKDSYPETINLKLSTSVKATVGKVSCTENIAWKGITINGENREQLKKDLSAKFDIAKEDALSKIKTPNYYWILIIPALVANSRNKKRRKTVADIIDNVKRTKINELDRALDGRVKANNVVRDFIKKPDWGTINFDGAVATENKTEGNA